LEVTILGNDLANFNAAGLEVIGTGNFTGGIFGGTF
jgi:hypothetical protein